MLFLLVEPTYFSSLYVTWSVLDSGTLKSIHVIGWSDLVSIKILSGKWYTSKENSHMWPSVPRITMYTQEDIRDSLYSPRDIQRGSDWIKVLMPSYHQIESINSFVFTGVINSIQEATGHLKVGWQTDLQPINSKGWKKYDQQARPETELEMKIQTPTGRVKTKVWEEKRAGGGGSRAVNVFICCLTQMEGRGLNYNPRERENWAK